MALHGRSRAVLSVHERRILLVHINAVWIQHFKKEQVR